MRSLNMFRLEEKVDPRQQESYRGIDYKFEPVLLC